MLLCGLLFGGSLRADESLAGKACRSVHLGYPAAAGEAFYCEVKVQQSAPGSYFMVCGWNTGYFGIQEIRPGRKVVLFSVWDNHKGDDPTDVDDDVRVKILHEGEDVKVSRFGGEGTGGKSMYDFDWKIGQTYRCLVTAKPAGKRTEYAGYFYLPDSAKWKHLVTFSTITGGKPLGGYYSFVEDFRRNGESARQIRKASFGNAWVKTTDGNWTPLRKARFTGDSNPAENIDAGTDGSMYYLATGGDTQNGGPQLRSFVKLDHSVRFDWPQGLPGALNHVQLIAHRGGVVDDQHIENNLPAIKAAIQRGYAMIEADIRESKDGELVVHHDADFKRYYGDDRLVTAMDWDEIKQLRSNVGNLRPLSFAEFASACRGQVGLMLDTKGEHGDEFFGRMETILRENQLLENALVLGTEQSQRFLQDKAKTSVNRAELESAIERKEDVSQKYYLFSIGAKIDAATVDLTNEHGVTVVAAINTFRYPAENHRELAEADIRRLQKLGVTHFQIDSVYDSVFDTIE